MFNNHGLFIDSYVPLYCSWTKKIIEPNSKGHLIINIRCLNTRKELNKRIIAIVIATSIRSQVKIPIKGFYKRCTFYFDVKILMYYEFYYILVNSLAYTIISGLERFIL
ncbi:hypothetical protein BNATCHR2101 (nucleomorph) [Bigelowiella natans]|uniref:Uncharacterized protein n=1 Tax=Bigelowiella natans TaxID=227086 RepID=Q3LW63_BIGNA|nr:hypothetical protein BNATCHR2101 [Bigelowiella natans]ABA27303.1 hypothetical protein [Bigelowiella natans]